jgi:hypothetical protein
MLAAQAQCAAHAFPPDLVVYEERADAVVSLLAAGSAYEAIAGDSGPSDASRPIQLERPPAHWITLAGTLASTSALELDPRAPLVFLHDRTTQNGQRRIVVAQFVSRQAYEPNRSGVIPRRQLIIQSFTVAAPGVPAVKSQGQTMYVSLRSDSTKPTKGFQPSALTLLAGQADPSDAAHFMIPYLIDGKAGVIDSWLRDDGIDLRPRHGRPAFLLNRAGWELDVSPNAAAAATGPATRP